MLYTAPSGAVQVAFLWVGVVGCWVFPRNRSLVTMALIIPPLIGNVLLLKLTVDAGWGMIASAWLVSATSHTDTKKKLLTTSGIMHNRRHVTPPLPDSVQLQMKHKTRHRQRNVIHRVLRRLHRLAPAVDREAALLQRSRDCHRNVVSFVHHDDCVPLRMYARQRRQGSGCKPSRSRRWNRRESGGGSSSR